MLFLSPDMPNLPPLPEFHGDTMSILDLQTAAFTHPTCLAPAAADNDTFGSPQRLAELGVQTLRLAAAHYYFSVRPILSAQVMATKVKTSTEGPKVHEILNAYKLKDKWMGPPGVDPQHSRADNIEMERLLHTLAGAFAYCNGAVATMKWFSAVLALSEGVKVEDIDVSPHEMSPPYEPNPPSGPPPPVPHSPSPTGDGAGVGPSDIVNLISLAYVNEVASRKKVQLSWSQEKVGQDHNPTWTVRCFVNGHEVGSATSAKAKTAKENAARQAFVNMGWHASPSAN